MEPLNASRLATNSGSNLESGSDSYGPVTGATLDSRTAKSGDIFIAIEGEQSDGHGHLDHAVANGATAVLVRESKLKSIDLPEGCAVLSHPDPVQALWDLAESVRPRLKARTLAVTGSYGKTTTKDFLGEILKGYLKTVVSPKSYNNHLGLPLTLINAAPDTEVLILELGTNHPGEIKKLSRLARPEVGMITGIGKAHAEGLGGREGILAEKMELLHALPEDGVGIIAGDQPDLVEEAEKTGLALLKFGYSNNCDLMIRGTSEISWDGLDIDFWLDNWSTDMKLPRLGPFQALNAAAALLGAKALGCSPDDSVEALEGLGPPVGGRMRHVVVGPTHILDDSYNSNPDAALAVVEYFSRLPGSPKTLVLGDMLELGDQSALCHQELGKAAARCGAARLVAVGTWSKEIRRGAVAEGMDENQTFIFSGWRETAKAADQWLAPGALVLLKASRKIGLDRLLESLIEKGSS